MVTQKITRNISLATLLMCSSAAVGVSGLSHAQDADTTDARIKAGDWVAVFHASANRDPDVFENPDAFILRRPNVGTHVTFGHGIHHCMGAGIAQNEAAQMINGILDRYQAIESAGDRKRQRGGLLNYGLETCPIRFVE